MLIPHNGPAGWCWLEEILPAISPKQTKRREKSRVKMISILMLSRHFIIRIKEQCPMKRAVAEPHDSQLRDQHAFYP